MNFEIPLLALQRLYFLQRTIILIFVGFIAVLFSVFLTQTKVLAQASNYSITDPSITVQLSEDNTALIMQSFALTNTAINGELLNGYKLVVPFTKIKNIEMKINGSPLQFASTENQILGITEIAINFPQPLFFSQSVQLHIQYQLTEYIQRAGNARFFLFGNGTVRDYNKYTNITLLIPQSFGEISLSSLQSIPEASTVGNLNKIELVNPDKVFYLIWGERYRVEVSQQSQLNNISAQSIRTLYQLIPSIAGQTITYTSQIAQAEYGIQDEFGNVFAAIQLDPQAIKPTGYNAIVTKDIADLQNVELNQDLPFELGGEGALQNILKDITKTDTVNAFYESYNYLVSNFNAVSITTDFTGNKQFWERINASNELNSFEFCGILSAVARELKINHALRYGYLTFYPAVIKQRSPHFWCIFEVEGQKLLFDPFVENALGIRYTNQKSEFDRIAVGTWNANISVYSSALGLTADQSEIQQITVDTDIFENDLDENQSVDFSLQTIDTVYAGFDFSAELKIQNNTGNALPLSAVLFNAHNITSGIEVKLPRSQFTVLPYQESTIALNNIKEPNYINYGLRAFEINLQFSDPENTSIKKTIFIQFLLYTPIIFLATVVIIFVSVLIFIIFYFVYKKRTHAISK